jgi:DNA-binding transcriptional MerR regulator
MDDDRGYLRIGTLGKRTGVSPELLRAWEQRYGLLEPSRSQGGFRLYSDRDEQRVRQMTALIERGLSAAEAARGVLSGERSASPIEPSGTLLDELRRDLTVSLDAMDGEGAHRAIDSVFATLSVPAALRDVVLPYLRELGDRWARGEVTVAEEHFATSLIRGRLMGIARGWGEGEGPIVVLACPPGELHEFGLIVFGIEVARRGWRVVYLGADTPMSTLMETVRNSRPALVVLGVTDAELARQHATEVRSLAAITPLALGGSIEPRDAKLFGARVLGGDPLDAAGTLAGWGLSPPDRSS